MSVQNSAKFYIFNMVKVGIFQVQCNIVKNYTVTVQYWEEVFSESRYSAELNSVSIVQNDTVPI